MTHIQHSHMISVLMPVYNGAKYISEAIESVLSQTFTDFELLIIDDGSTDETVEIINRYSDNRIILIQNHENRGLIYTLNKGLKLAKGKYIARMDADDICLSERFRKQVEYLEAHADIVVLGTAFSFLGTLFEIHHPNYPEEIQVKLLDDNAFCHPSVMMRKDTILSNQIEYNSSYKHVEDYYFWTEIAMTGLKMANLDDVLLQYRQHDEQISTRKFDEQETSKLRIKNNYLSHYFRKYLSEAELSLVNNNLANTIDRLTVLDKLKKLSKEHNIFYQSYFENYLELLIYRSFPENKTVSNLEIMSMIKKNVSLSFIKTILKIKLKKLLNK